MSRIPVILIFDVGKTNKKMLLFNRSYEIVYEETCSLPETVDEDGYPCEDVELLTTWIKEGFAAMTADDRFDVKAVNFSGYGASFVHLDGAGNPVTPLYNYLKPFPEDLLAAFYERYGGMKLLCRQTASPSLGSLNSGLQLYRIKKEKPSIFEQIRYSLHLPQYLSYILSGQCFSELTSIGCHTHLWNFEKAAYHEWVIEEGLIEKFPAVNTSMIAGQSSQGIPVGVGLHDSSAALIPYMNLFDEPFLLLSTGTWCISMNPFNDSPLTDRELENDCLCYLSYQGKQVKSSRLFAGYEHDQYVKQLAEIYQVPVDHYTSLAYDPSMVSSPSASTIFDRHAVVDIDRLEISSYDEAYHVYVAGLVARQYASTSLVLNNTDVKCIYVDGGFSRNPIYMQLLAEVFSDFKVFAATVSQASATGAAVAIHNTWNSSSGSLDKVELTRYVAGHSGLTGS